MLYHIDRFPAPEPGELPAAPKLLGEKPYIDPTSQIYDSHIGSWTDIGANSTIALSTIDDYTYTAGDNSIIYTDIGKFCSIASHVRINPGNHPMQRATQHHMTYRRQEYGFGADDREFFAWREAHRCVIDHDVWMGHGVIVMPGVHVGTGAVLGSGAVVTKNVEPYMIVGGVPAKPIRRRFSEAISEKLLAIAWWNWNREQLEARFDDLLNIETFVEKYGQ